MHFSIAGTNAPQAPQFMPGSSGVPPSGANPFLYLRFPMIPFSKFLLFMPMGVVMTGFNFSGATSIATKRPVWIERGGASEPGGYDERSHRGKDSDDEANCHDAGLCFTHGQPSVSCYSTELSNTSY
jgi:hypothetical protein